MPQESVLDLLSAFPAEAQGDKLAQEMTHFPRQGTPFRLPDLLDLIASIAAERQDFASRRIEGLATTD